MAHTNRPKTLLSILLLVTLVVSGCHEAETADDDASSGDGDTGDTSPIEIGALMPMTGEAASLGVPAMQGARLAVAEINDAGGIDGRELVLVEGDTQFPETDKAIAEFNRIAGRGVEYVVGALTSDASAAVKSQANEAQVVLVSPSSTRPSLTGPDHGYFFRVIASDAVQGPQAAQLLYEDLDQDSAVVMFEQTGYAQGIKDQFVSAYQDLGGTVNGEPIAYTNDETTMQNRAADAVDRDPAFIWIGGQAPQVASLIKSIRDQGYGGQIMTSEAIEAQSIFDVAPEAVDGVLFTKSAPDPERQAFKDFESAYRARWDSAPGPFDAFAYDAVYVGKAAIEAVGNDATQIKDWMENNAVDGRVTTDTIRFNSNGDVTTGGYSLWEVEYSDGEGTFVPYSG